MQRNIARVATASKTLAVGSLAPTALAGDFSAHTSAVSMGMVCSASVFIVGSNVFCHSLLSGRAIMLIRFVESRLQAIASNNLRIELTGFTNKAVNVAVYK